MNLCPLAIGTNTLNHTIPAGIFSASRAVITTRARMKLAPTFCAQTFVSFTYTFAAIDADRRPKKLIYPLQDKLGSLFYLSCIHTGNYMRINSYFKLDLL
jgi:hypothetical protein